MKEKNLIEECQSHIVENGMVHLEYHQNDINDIIHCFSIEGKEFLSDDFISFIEKYRHIIPQNLPLVIDVIGNPLTCEEEEIIERTILSRFALKMTKVETQYRKIIKWGLVFILFALLSAIPIFAVRNEPNEIIETLAYIPLWFFAERTLIFTLFDGVPVLRDRSWYRYLASSKVIFSGTERKSLDELDYYEVSSEAKKHRKDASAESRYNQHYIKQMLRDGLVSIQCKIDSFSDVIQVPALKGKEVISDELGDFLSHVLTYLKSNTGVMMTIENDSMNEQEREITETAIRRYYKIEAASDEAELRFNSKYIFWFSLLFVVSIMGMVVYGSINSDAFHELLIIVFWFFIDSIMEFLCITQIRAYRSKKQKLLLMNMTIKWK